MKKLLFAAIAASALTSCGLEDTSIKLNNPESFTKIAELAKSNFGEEKEIYSFEIGTQDHLTSELESLTIEFLDNGADYDQDYNLDNESGKELEEPKKKSAAFQNKFILKNKQGKIKIKDLDFALINIKYEEAVSTISDEYEDFTLHNWEYEVNNKGEITANFKIEGTKKGESTSVQGRNIVTNYYEFAFEMNVDKTLTYRE